MGRRAGRACLTAGMVLVGGLFPSRVGWAEEPAAPLALAVTTAALASPAQEVEVIADAPRNAASNQDILDQDFLLRPHPRPADILSVVPGLFTVQHQGGGKANQYFLRGFDADHGTDIAFFIDGVPINLPSHAHGQGYSDLHFLIPEVIDRIEVMKGPYYASVGDFATAGAVNFVTHRGMDGSYQEVGGGMFGSYRSLTVLSPDLPNWKPLLAAEVYGTNGPFVNPEDLFRFNLFVKLTHDFSAASSLSLVGTSYGTNWYGSGQIPQRAVDEGIIGRFGSIDPTEGGNSQRHQLYALFHSVDETGGALDLSAWAVAYRLSLFNDFTFFSVDPVNGDEINQTDLRTLLGARGSYKFLRMAGGIPFVTTFGFWLRQDDVDNGLFHARQRVLIGSMGEDSLEEGNIAAYAEESVVPCSGVRAVLGLREDYIGVQVQDLLHPPGSPANGSGQTGASQLSPKASLIFTPDPALDVYLNYGRGFHSNDARGAVLTSGAATLIVPADGYEIGATARLFDRRLDLTAAAFLLDLQSELVWNGDTGGTTPSGATRRYGTELTARAKLSEWLWADSDLTLSNAVYKANQGNGNAVALAPKEIYQGGLSVRRPDGVYGRLGVFQIGDRPATSDGFLTAKGFTRLDATVGLKRGRWAAEVDVQNLTDTTWDEAQFATVSRLQNETGPASCPAGTRPDFGGAGGAFDGCQDIDFTPGNPINVQASLSYSF